MNIWKDRISSIRWCRSGIGVWALALIGAGVVAPAQTPAVADHAEAEGFVSIFNGKDLNGWDGEPGWWSVEDGALTSLPHEPSKSTYITWRGGQPSDFELTLEYRIESGNSGVQIRSQQLPKWQISGYQADIEAGDTWTGCLFEHKRGGVSMRGDKTVIAADGKKTITSIGNSAELLKSVKKNDWNAYRIVARGSDISLYLNGVLMTHAIDDQPDPAARRGVIGFQIHPGPPMKVQFRNIRLKQFTPLKNDDRTKENLSSTKPPAPSPKAISGFTVERLLTVDRKAHGSWVSMCADPAGRLYVCDQYEHGLYRVTPGAPGPQPQPTKIEKIAVDLRGAQGLAWVADRLYALVTQNRGTSPSGLYRIRDTNSDDQLDAVELLHPLEGGGDHGWHGLVAAPDGQSIYVVAGNHTKGPPLAGSHVPLAWSEDQLLPRLPDARGHMVGVLAPGGCIYRVDLDGRHWRLIANGFRNTYDVALHRDGDLFTYDADMEWDIGLPWYRPTRICQITSGAEFGWRHGSGKWPAHYPDSLPAVVDIGPGSPTGVCFGYGSRFPAKYQNALFVCDWTYGKLFAIHLRPHGSSYMAEVEPFVTGQPLPLTDVLINPVDGAMYLLTGGWSNQSELYRVTYTGHPDTNALEPPSKDDRHGAQARALRRRLESFHGRQDAAAVDAAWPHLSHTDRFIRFAARVALEWQDADAWRQRALAERDPSTALAALLALVRVSSRDEFHRHPSRTAPDPTLQERVIEALNRIDWRQLTDAQRLECLRVYAVTFTRLGEPAQALRRSAIARIDPLYPASTPQLNSQLCQLLVYLESPHVVQKTLELLARASTKEEQIEYIRCLRVASGWSLEQRKAYFTWFIKAAGYQGGNSFPGYLRNIKADAIGRLTDAEKAALSSILQVKYGTAALPEALTTALAGRAVVKNWTVDDLAPLAQGSLEGRDFDRGRRMFVATGCFSCHRMGSDGGTTGPDLTAVAGRFGPRDLLLHIVDPSAAIDEKYASTVVRTADGDVLVGRIVNQNDMVLSLNTDMFNPDATVQLRRDQIHSVAPSKLSPMPQGLLNVLNGDEIGDLMAYLLSGGKRDHAMFQQAGEGPPVK